MKNKSFEYSYIDELVSETDDIRKESLLNKLKSHLTEMDRSCKFIDDLRSKFTILQEEFNRLANEKKRIEIDSNRKISQLSKEVVVLQSEKEQLQMKYKSTKQKLKSIESSHIKEIEAYKIENAKNKKDNDGLTCDIQDLIKENDSLISQINSLYSQQANNNSNSNSNNNKEKEKDDQRNVIDSYHKQLQEANDSINKMIVYIKELEHKNEKLIEEVENSHNMSITPNANNDVISGLKRIITEKEKTISTLYNNYDKLNIQLEDSNSRNEELLEQIKALKLQFNNNNNDDNDNDDYSDENDNKYMSQY